MLRDHMVIDMTVLKTLKRLEEVEGEQNLASLKIFSPYPHGHT
jgi:hypothetical protein